MGNPCQGCDWTAPLEFMILPPLKVLSEIFFTSVCFTFPQLSRDTRVHARHRNKWRIGEVTITCSFGIFLLELSEPMADTFSLTHHCHASMILVTKLDAQTSRVKWLSKHVSRQTYSNVCKEMSQKTIVDFAAPRLIVLRKVCDSV